MLTIERMVLRIRSPKALLYRRALTRPVNSICFHQATLSLADEWIFRWGLEALGGGYPITSVPLQISSGVALLVCSLKLTFAYGWSWVQVKIDGERIELGEIETCLKNAPTVLECAIDARAVGGSILCALVAVSCICGCSLVCTRRARACMSERYSVYIFCLAIHCIWFVCVCVCTSCMLVCLCIRVQMVCYVFPTIGGGIYSPIYCANAVARSDSLCLGWFRLPMLVSVSRCITIKKIVSSSSCKFALSHHISHINDVNASAFIFTVYIPTGF